jgi:hypothetical protein
MPRVAKRISPKKSPYEFSSNFFSIEDIKITIKLDMRIIRKRDLVKPSNKYIPPNEISEFSGLESKQEINVMNKTAIDNHKVAFRFSSEAKISKSKTITAPKVKIGIGRKLFQKITGKINSINGPFW